MIRFLNQNTCFNDSTRCARARFSSPKFYSPLAKSEIMNCRVTHVRFGASKEHEIVEVMESKRETMMALPGIQSVCIIVTGEGEITSFAVYDTKENFDAAPPRS